MPIYIVGPPGVPVADVVHAAEEAKRFLNEVPACANLENIPDLEIHAGARPEGVNYQDAVEMVINTGNSGSDIMGFWDSNSGANRIALYKFNKDNNAVNFFDTFGRALVLHEVLHVLGIEHDACSNISVMQEALGSSNLFGKLNLQVFPIHCQKANEGNRAFFVEGTITGLDPADQVQLRLAFVNGNNEQILTSPEAFIGGAFTFSRTIQSGAFVSMLGDGTRMVPPVDFIVAPPGKTCRIDNVDNAVYLPAITMDEPNLIPIKCECVEGLKVGGSCGGAYTVGGPSTTSLCPRARRTTFRAMTPAAAARVSIGAARSAAAM